MFRGIDPDGLNCLAIQLARQTGSGHRLSSATAEILGRNGRTSDAAEVAAVVARALDWSRQTCHTLQWRAAAIENGQGVQFSLAATLRAQFAVASSFSMENLSEIYQRWTDQFAASRRHIEETVIAVSAWLDQTWTDWDVTNADLHNIWQALDGLPPSELERVIAGLSPRQLGRWIAEMGNSINGFSRSEKREVFALLTGSADSLGKLHDAILANGTPADAIDFATAVRDTVGDLAIARFVADVLATDLETTPFSTVAMVIAIGEVEESATVNKLIDQIVKRGALPLLVADSLALTDGTDPLVSLGRALARVTDPQVAVAAFRALVPLATDAAAQRRLLTRTGSLERLRTASLAMSQAESDLLELANQLLVTSPEQIIQSLATEADPTGVLFTDFLYELVDGGASASIGAVAAALRGGHDVDPLRFAHIGTDADYRYPHAQNLAYFGGALNNALARYADHAKDDINLVTAAAAVANLLVAPLFAALSTGVPTAMVEAGLGYGYANAVHDDINASLVGIHNVVSASLQPTVTVTGMPNELGESALWWDRRYRIVRSGDAS